MQSYQKASCDLQDFHNEEWGFQFQKFFCYIYYYLIIKANLLRAICYVWNNISADKFMSKLCEQPFLG